MEKFEPITRIEVRVNCSLLSPVSQQVESISDFCCLVQRNKGLDELFLNIEEKQKKLIRLVSDCIICLSFLLSDSTNRKKFLLSRYSEDILTTRDPLEIIRLMENGIIISSKSFIPIDYINELCSEYFKIYESGAKSIERAVEKTRARLRGNPALLNDTIRITISPLRPEYLDYIVDFLIKTNNVLFKPRQWTISPSGVLHNGCFVDIDGNVAQIAIDERLQRETNITCSHEIYEVMRLMESEDFQFSLEHIDKTTPKKVMDGYNYIMRKYGQITDIKLNPIEDISLFQPDKLHFRYRELLLLHQNIHIDAICRVDERWQELYCSLMMDMNYKNKIEHREETFPEFLLEKIPNYRRLYKFKFTKVKEDCNINLL